jgi:hypothetical protein
MGYESAKRCVRWREMPELHKANTRDDVRAVLVTRKQRDDTDVLYSTWGDGMSTAEHAALGEIVDAYDAAADQPRIQWCVEHQTAVRRLIWPDTWFHLDGAVEYSHCTIVEALVVPLPEASE